MTIAISLMTKVDDSFILNSKITNKISKTVHEHSEFEIIRISDKPIQCKILIYDSDIIKNFNTLKNLKGIDLKHHLMIYYDPSNIRYIKNPSEKVQKTSIDHNYRSIQYIKEPTEKMQMRAMKFSNLSIIFINNPTEQVQMKAINSKPDLIKYIKKPTRKVQMAVVKHDPILYHKLKQPYKSVTDYYNKVRNQKR